MTHSNQQHPIKHLWRHYRSVFPSGSDDFTPLQFILAVLFFESASVVIGILTS